MTDRLTDDEIKALRVQVLGYHSLRDVVRLLDEIEERRREDARAEQIIRDEFRKLGTEESICEPCKEDGRIVAMHSETADGVFVCKECFDACEPQRKDGGA